jgi:hypothetical protein
MAELLYMAPPLHPVAIQDFMTLSLYVIRHLAGSIHVASSLISFSMLSTARRAGAISGITAVAKSSPRMTGTYNRQITGIYADSQAASGYA